MIVEAPSAPLARLDRRGAPGAECFRELDLLPPPAGVADSLAETRVFEIVCP